MEVENGHLSCAFSNVRCYHFTGAYARPTFCLRHHSVGLRAGQSWDRLPTRPTRVELLFITACFFAYAATVLEVFRCCSYAATKQAHRL